MSLSDEKFISFTTYRSSGEPVSTPVWVVPVGEGRIGFWTAMGTGKTRRLAHSPRITVQPCDRAGKVRPGSIAISGEAEMVRSGVLFDEVQGRIRSKYGFMTRISQLFARLGPQGRAGLIYADTVVLVRLHDEAGEQVSM